MITDPGKLGESGLVFDVVARFEGDAASESFEIGWVLSEARLGTCNRNGREIPYPQVVVRPPDED